MRLRIEWVKATRGSTERVRLETTARDAILEAFNGVENAFRAHERYKSGDYRNPMSDWGRILRASIAAASHPLPPSERQRVQVIAHFER